MNALRRVLGRHSDIALVALVIGVMTVLFTPIPSSLLDLLILIKTVRVVLLGEGAR